MGFTDSPVSLYHLCMLVGKSISPRKQMGEDESNNEKQLLGEKK